MSTYLLLRNNQESGPFTMDEIRAMSLRPYDLIWVAGKSAAWRYPGEIPELKPFAPPVPETLDSGKMPAQKADSLTTQKAESVNTRNRDKLISPGASPRSIYVNLPTEKKVVQQKLVLPVTEPVPLPDETTNGLTEYYALKPSRPVRYTGKILWVGSIIILFGAGILTGFIISDRRKFFSSDSNPRQSAMDVKPELNNSRKENSTSVIQVKQTETGDVTMIKTDSSLKQDLPKRPKSVLVSEKKKNKFKIEQSDSAVNHSLLVVSNTEDSLKQVNAVKTAVLYQKIKSHPENYINCTTGHFTTGVFGGISSFPVTATNNSVVMMDEVVVTIDYIQNNDKVYKTEQITFNDLEAGEAVTIKAPKSSRGIKISTRIQTIRSRQLDLSYSN